MILFGRKTGKERATPLVYLWYGDDTVVVGSLAGYNMHPFWKPSADSRNRRVHAKVR